jgi:hypothetical protein
MDQSFKLTLRPGIGSYSIQSSTYKTNPSQKKKKRTKPTNPELRTTCSLISARRAAVAAAAPVVSSAFRGAP